MDNNEIDDEDFLCRYPAGVAQWCPPARTTWNGNLSDTANPRGRSSVRSYSLANGRVSPKNKSQVDGWSIARREGNSSGGYSKSMHAGTKSMARNKNKHLNKHDVPATRTEREMTTPKIPTLKYETLEQAGDYRFLLFHPGEIYTDFFLVEITANKVRRSEGYGSLAKAKANSLFKEGVTWGEWTSHEEQEDLFK